MCCADWLQQVPALSADEAILYTLTSGMAGPTIMMQALGSWCLSILSGMAVGAG